MADELAVAHFASIVDLVGRAIDSFPDELALRDGPEALSYELFNQYGESLADRLRARGVGPESLIGVCLPRGLDRIALILAAWRCGAAVALLDPAWPDRRLAQVVEESGCALVALAQGAGPRGMGDRAMEIGAAHRASVPARSPRPAVALAPEDLAYVIYTSGSTGRPKGVEITHGNLAALVEWHRAAFAVSHRDRAGHLAGLAFDASVWEIWPYLAVGASVHLVPDAARTSGERLRDWLVESRATIAFAPTLLAEELVALPWPETPLRTLLTGGDRLRVAPPPGLPFTLVNNYGPTECTVVACSAPVPPAVGLPETPSIGRPIDGAYVRILREDGQQAGAGEIGEICVGGRIVGRGYRGQPAATAAAFVPDPFAEAPGARLYRTGDLGSWRADGAIDFHGRADGQLKIRGQRVEPDEIAAVLIGHARVRAAAVVGLDRPDGVALAAYLEPVPGPLPAAEELHAYLAERLPDWSVPSWYVAVERLPVTAHGKLDRAALPEPAPDNALPTCAHADAASPAEARLLAILGEVMGEREVGVDDNFFLLGGHSLLGTQVVLRAGEAFGIELTLRDLFQAPTVRELAVRIEELVEEAVAAMSEEALLRAHG